VRNFEFLEPRSVSEASRMLSDHGETARLLAGGTALLLLMRQRIVSPSHLVSLDGVPGLSHIEVDDRNGARIGALARHSDIEAHPGLRAKYPVIAEMARRVANPQIRNMATIGGNLCHGDPASDPPACFLALGGEVKAVRGSQERVIRLEEFFTDYYETALAPDEILTEIRIPPLPKGSVGVYARFMTTAAEHRPLVGVGLLLTLDGRDVCRDIRIALGAVTPIPARLGKVEAFLRGKRLVPDAIAQAGEIAATEIRPQSDFRASAEYRKEVTRVMVRRAVERALTQASAT
jgi:carbon-monoxide dehydrogenase medium subunit